MTNGIRFGELLQRGVDQFETADLYYGHGTDNAWDEAVFLAGSVLDLPLDATDEVLDLPLTATQLAKIEDLFRRRISERMPAAYLIGKSYFAGLEFIVTPEVLVPRSPIAELIEQGFAPWLAREPQRVLDLCSGNGCIGIAMAAYFPDAQVDLSDISPQALAVAQRNIDKHAAQFHLRERVRTVESDLFANLADQRYELIVCNPPYVDADDFAAMPQEYRAEPELALQSGIDGLDFTRRLLAEAGDHLTAEGLLIIEVGNSWTHLEDAYPQVPFMWLEFEYGGHGVFAITAQELKRYRVAFAAGNRQRK